MPTTAPSTPSTPRRIAMNRSFTVPSKLATTTNTSLNTTSVEIGATKDVETLYMHPRTSIIKFSIAPSSRPSTSSSTSPRSANTSNTTAPAGFLPWTSRTERTLASGPLEIYRVPGSVSFLHSGTLLHAILPRSQCWCVDGVSKFTMRVLPETYYRIELPATTPEDMEKVEELKVVLAKVLFYERTACPFDRGLEEVKPTAEELHERRKSRRVSLGPAKRWRLEGRYSWRPEEGDLVGRGGGRAGDTEESEESEGEEVEAGADAGRAREDLAVGVEQLSLRQQKPARPSELATMRSVTAPPQLIALLHKPPGMPAGSHLDGTVETSEPAPVPRPQLDPTRLRTFQSMPTDMPPSPPDSSAGLELAEAHVRRQLDEVEVGAETSDVEEEQHDVKERNVTKQDVVPSRDESPAQERISESSAPVDQRYEDTTAHRSPLPAQPQAAEERRTHEASSPSNKKVVPEDPFAAIQARILARRSIGSTPTKTTTTTSHNPSSSPHSTTSSSSSTTSLASRTSTTSSTSTTRPRLPRSQSTTQQQTLASALVHKACAVFLGPPAQLVAIMLKIAARLTNETLAFGAGFIFQSPAGSKRVPGSFDLESLDAEDLEGMVEGEEEEEQDGGGEGEWGGGGGDGLVEEEGEGEDDFGVPLRSPIRLAKMGGAGGGGGGFMRDRRKGAGG